jgi:endoglucanase
LDFNFYVLLYYNRLLLSIINVFKMYNLLLSNYHFMKRIFSLALIVLSILNSQAQLSTSIRLNQIGFYSNGPKKAAIVGSSATSFTIKSTDRLTTHFTGTLGTASTWAQSNESVKIADFTTFTKTGTYVLDVAGVGYSYTFTIADNALVPLNKALIKAYYFNRTSIALDTKYAGKWARVAGHLDNSVIVHPSAASTLRPAGTIISAPKGWYDAGDYNSYIVNSGISTYTLLMSYEHFSDYYDTLNLNIPESNNSLPDILDEIKWNLDWMLTMQDPNDGGVYNKKTCAAFCDFIMPVKDTATRYVVTKSTSSACDFAAVMAVAYRIYKQFDATYANTCLDAAKRAHTWALANPSISFSNPGKSGIYPAIGTGGYGDSNLSDELEWAGNELYIATKDETKYGYKSTNTYSLPDWASVRMLGMLSLIFNRKNLTAKGFADTTSMKNKLLNLVNAYVTYQKNTSPYRVVMGTGGNADFVWGSNAFAANQAMLIMNAYMMTNNIDYANAAVSQVDYLVGRNATGYSFVTGIGSKPGMNIHHRQSGADGITDPVPGWLSGGPSGSTGDGCTNNTTYLATSFSDLQACYTKNEIAINWNAPAVYITGALEYLKLFNTPIVNALEGDVESFENFTIFPVPAKDVLNLRLDGKLQGMATIKLADVMGVEVASYQSAISTSDNTITVPLTGLEDGIYMVNIEVDNKKFKQKVIINQ